MDQASLSAVQVPTIGEPGLLEPSFQLHSTSAIAAEVRRAMQESVKNFISYLI
jgi:hypothetical protein